ncbi:MAG: hypothetical protein ACKPKO_31765, partial [Candidatus Fonsibacter sp.]
WEHKQYKLTMTMLDTFDYENDDLNVLPTTIYRHMRSRDYTPNNLFFTVYKKQRDHRQYHILYKGGSDICVQARIQTPRFQNDLNIYRIYYINTWRTRRNQSARIQQQQSKRRSRSSESITETTTRSQKGV